MQRKVTSRPKIKCFIETYCSSASAISHWPNWTSSHCNLPQRDGTELLEERPYQDSVYLNSIFEEAIELEEIFDGCGRNI
jgi:hypothetical protein